MTSYTRSGYQGKRDAMRERADEEWGKEYKRGGKACHAKFAMGGVAKIRHEQSTASGKPKNYKKEPVSRTR